MWMSNKLLCGPDVSKLINLIPNHHTTSPGWTPTTDSELTMSLGGAKPGKKEDPSSPCMKGRWIGWLCQAPKAVCPPIFLEWLGNSWLSGISLPPTQSNRGSSHSGPSWCGPMTITRMHICLPWVWSEGLQYCKPQWLSPHRWIWHAAWHL